MEGLFGLMSVRKCKNLLGINSVRYIYRQSLYLNYSMKQ